MIILLTTELASGIFNLRQRSSLADPEFYSMSSDQLAFETASARPILGPVVLPWLGHVDTEWAARMNSPWASWDRSDTTEKLPTQVCLGRLRVTFYRDASLRFSWFTWTALAFVAGDVAGWTEGHLWRLF